MAESCIRCSLVLPRSRMTLCPYCGAVQSKREGVPPPSIPSYPSQGIGLAELLALVSGLLAMASFLSPWIYGVVPVYSSQTGYGTRLTSQLSGLDLLSLNMVLGALPVAAAIGAIVALSSSSLLAGMLGRSAAPLKKALAAAGSAFCLLPPFIFTIGYSTGSPVMIGSRVLVPLSSLGIGLWLSGMGGLGYLVSWLLLYARE